MSPVPQWHTSDWWAGWSGGDSTRPPGAQRIKKANRQSVGWCAHGRMNTAHRRYPGVLGEGRVSADTLARPVSQRDYLSLLKGIIYLVSSFVYPFGPLRRSSDFAAAFK